MGHGVLMTCAALYLVIRESRILSQKTDNEVRPTKSADDIVCFSFLLKCANYFSQT
jgi:hypothetical protein